MEYIKKEELIIGEIYKSTLYNHIFKYLDKNGDKNPNISKTYNVFNKDLATIGHGLDNIINTTSEEKHWLNEAIRLDKFITFEEAMKTFIPEYVECIKTSIDRFTKNKIYKVEDKDYVKTFVLLDDKNVNTTLPMIGSLWSFKPSTKEAYDAQFVVKEPLPQFKIIESIETITKVENNEGNQFFIGDVVKTEDGLHFKIIGFKYDENKTKILAIATDNYPEVVKDINDIEHYIESKVEETLLDEAKKLYPVGTKFINPNDNRECVIKEKGNYFEGNNHNIYHSIANCVFKYEEGLSGCIYINNTWSKIIE